MDEQQQAAQALATVAAHQERARSAARLPWWAYLAMFLLSAAGTAANDFVAVPGTTLMALVILIVLVIVLVIGFATGSAPLSALRRVQPRQAFVPRVFGAFVIIGGAGIWLVASYGTALGHDLANAVGLPHYPYTVLGVVYGIVFTALFALGQFLTGRAAR